MSHTVYMTENTHSFLNLFFLAITTSKFGIASAEPAAGTHLVKVAMWSCVHANVFTGLLHLFYKRRGAEAK